MLAAWEALLCAAARGDWLSDCLGLGEESTSKGAAELGAWCCGGGVTMGSAWPVVVWMRARRPWGRSGVGAVSGQGRRADPGELLEHRVLRLWVVETWAADASSDGRRPGKEKQAEKGGSAWGLGLLAADRLLPWMALKDRLLPMR